MPHLRRSFADADLSSALAALRQELDVPEAFPDPVIAEAAAAAAAGPTGEREDQRDLPLVTIDPPGSRDLDQALHIQQLSQGRHRVDYAIADVAAFVAPGGAVDAEAWTRGVSRYSPDLVTPLHPPALSEGAASLLPGVARPAVLWSMTLDASGELIDTHVRRATVRSRAQLTYAQAQAAIDAGGDAMLASLAVVGRLREEREWVRGGVSLDLPDQEVHTGAGGAVELVYRAPLPVEAWNAQLSLLTGMAAGQLMLDAGIGVLRTLPAPEEAAVEGLRRRAWALRLPWPPEISYDGFVRTLDPHDPLEAAMIAMAAVGLRGAGYAAFTHGAPADHRHEALAAVYAHVTAPLRRLVDRYAGEVALAIAADVQTPDWVMQRLSDLPKAMGKARGRAGALDRAVLALVESHVLADRVGEAFNATVVGVAGDVSHIQLRSPAVTATVSSALPLGREVVVRLTAVDVAARTVTFVPLS